MRVGSYLVQKFSVETAALRREFQLRWILCLKISCIMRVGSCSAHKFFVGTAALHVDWAAAYLHNAGRAPAVPCATSCTRVASKLLKTAINNKVRN